LALLIAKLRRSRKAFALNIRPFRAFPRVHSVAIRAATAIVRAKSDPWAARPFRRREPTQGTPLMFITPAFAQTLPFGADGGMLTSLLPFVLIFVIMYFLILRPQQKRVKQHQEMVKNVRRGDTVVTNGGLVGKVTKVVDDEQIEIEIGEGVKIRQMRQMLTDVRSKGEPVKDDAAAS
jgi:preprotein translocase subunit YajC